MIDDTISQVEREKPDVSTVWDDKRISEWNQDQSSWNTESFAQRGGSRSKNNKKTSRGNRPGDKKKASTKSSKKHKRSTSAPDLMRLSTTLPNQLKPTSGRTKNKSRSMTTKVINVVSAFVGTVILVANAVSIRRIAIAYLRSTGLEPWAIQMTAIALAVLSTAFVFSLFHLLKNPIGQGGKNTHIITTKTKPYRSRAVPKKVPDSQLENVTKVYEILAVDMQKKTCTLRGKDKIQFDRSFDERNLKTIEKTLSEAQQKGLSTMFEISWSPKGENASIRTTPY